MGYGSGSCGPEGRLAVTLGTAVTAFAALVFFFSIPALAAPMTLATIVISDTLPGFVASPPGVRNGPLTQSEVSLVAPNNSTLASDLSQEMGNGDLTAYIRVCYPNLPMVTLWQSLLSSGWTLNTRARVSLRGRLRPASVKVKAPSRFPGLLTPSVIR